MDGHGWHGTIPFAAQKLVEDSAAVVAAFVQLTPLMYYYITLRESGAVSTLVVLPGQIVWW